MTVHPSYLLRLPDAEAKAREYQRFVDDLRIAAAHVSKSGTRGVNVFTLSTVLGGNNLTFIGTTFNCEFTSAVTFSGTARCVAA